MGFILFFAFFGKLVLIALRAMREAATDLTPLLIGIVVSLIVVVARYIQAETRAHSSAICGQASDL